MVRITNLWFAFVMLPWAWTEAVFGEMVIIEDETVPNIWGFINLIVAMTWFVYYVGFFWRKRITTMGNREESEMADVTQRANETQEDNHRAVKSMSTSVSVAGAETNL